MIRAVQKGEIRPPRHLDASIDKALEAICVKAMAHRPADRYGSARALAEDVERWMADEAVSAWREPRTRTMVRWLTRHRVSVTAAGAAVLVALVGTAAVLGVQTRANADLNRANTELNAANARVTRANDDLHAANKRERQRFELAQEAIRMFHSGVSEDLLLKQGQFKALRTKLLQGARDFYRKLEGLLKDRTDRDSRLGLARAYAEVGRLSSDLDSVKEAEEVDRRAVALFEELAGEAPTDPEPRRGLARCLVELESISWSVGRKEEAAAMVSRAVELYRALGEADPADLRLRGEWAGAEMLCGMFIDASTQPAEAVAAVERARSILEAATGAGAPEDALRAERAEVYGALASTLYGAGRHDEAMNAFKKACELGEAMFRANPEDPKPGHELARNLGNWGVDLSNAGRPADALPKYVRALEVLKTIGDANPTLSSIPGAVAWLEYAPARRT